jgi:dipeptidyl aminopeptidase/acylaminoacyl peptidase
MAPLNSGVVEVEDVAAVVQHLKAAPNVDPGRIAGVGSSYGGYGLLLVAGKHPDLLSAVSVTSPMCDPEGMSNDPGARPEFRTAFRRRYGGTPEQAPENWRRASPLTYAHAIRCRVQLTDNEHDPRGLVTLNDKSSVLQSRSKCGVWVAGTTRPTRPARSESRFSASRFGS